MRLIPLVMFPSNHQNLAKNLLHYCVEYLDIHNGLSIDKSYLNTNGSTLIELILSSQKVHDLHNIINNFCDKHGVTQQQILAECDRTYIESLSETRHKSKYRLRLQPITITITNDNLYVGLEDITIGFRIIIESMPKWYNYFQLNYWIS